MAIITPLITGKSTGAETTAFVTSAYSLAPNTLGLLSVGYQDAAGPITVDGGGATWVALGGIVPGGNVRLAVFRAMSTAGLTNIQSTIRLTGVTVGSDAIVWSLIQVGNVSTLSTDGAGAIENTTGAVGTTVNSSLSFNLNASPGNIVVGVFAQGSSAAWTAGASYAPVHSLQAESTGLGGASTAISLLVEQQLNTTVVSAVGATTAFKGARGLAIAETTVETARGNRMMMGVGR